MAFEHSFTVDALSSILAKFGVTMQLTLLSLLLAMVVGIPFAYFIQKKTPVVSQICRFICSFLKGVPVLIFLYLAFNVLPDILIEANISYDRRNPPEMLFGVLAFGLAYVPYLADMYVTAYCTVPKGQIEACKVAGMTTLQGMRRIIFPQMVVVAVPVFGNHFVNMLKMTSLAYLVNLVEMMGAAKNFATKFQMFLETYVIVALVYWAICIAFDLIFAFVERKLGKYREKTAEVEKKKFNPLSPFKKRRSNP